MAELLPAWLVYLAFGLGIYYIHRADVIEKAKEAVDGQAQPG